MEDWKLEETKIRHRDCDELRQRHLEEIADLEWRLADTNDRELIPLIKALYEQLEYYDEMRGYM